MVKLDDFIDKQVSCPLMTLALKIVFVFYPMQIAKARVSYKAEGKKFSQCIRTSEGNTGVNKISPTWYSTGKYDYMMLWCKTMIDLLIVIYRKSGKTMNCNSFCHFCLTHFRGVLY